MKKTSWQEQEFILIDRLLIFAEGKELFDALMARAKEICPDYRHPLERFFARDSLKRGFLDEKDTSLEPSWYGDANGRVALELEQSQIEVVGIPISPEESEPVSRREPQRNLMDFMRQCAEELV